MPGRPTIFIDRDGVINRERVDHVKQWREFEFLPGVFEALGRLSRYGYQLVVITNQACINRKMTSSGKVDYVHRRMRGALSARGIPIRAVFVCPHRPDEGCKCRKPGVELFHRAAALCNVDFRRSWAIGDKGTDIEAARTVGCRPIRVPTNGNLDDSLRRIYREMALPKA